MDSKEFAERVISLENETNAKRQLLDDMEERQIITSEQKDRMFFEIAVCFETSVRFYLGLMLEPNGDTKK